MKLKANLYFLAFMFFTSSSGNFYTPMAMPMQGMSDDHSATKCLKKQENFIVKESLEVGKIILLSTALSVVYGISHDLITTNLCFDYFASDLTHHGPVTREHFPAVYRSNSKILYALLWGTIATWWVGAIAGAVWAIAARSNPEIITWREIIIPATIFLSALLASSITVGFVEYRKTGSNFKTVASMHNWSYSAGALGAIVMAVYIFNMQGKPKSMVKLDASGVGLDLAQIFMS